MTASPIVPRAPAPPGPAGWPLLGQLFDLRRRSVGAMQEWHQRFGDVVRFNIGPRAFYMISHPALAEQVLVSEREYFPKIHDPAKPFGIGRVLGQGLVTAQGETWRRNRALIQPYFHRSAVAGHGPIMESAAARLVDRVSSKANGEAFDLSAEILGATLEIVSRALFSEDWSGNAGVLGPALTTVLRFANRDISQPWRLPPPWPTPENRAFGRAMRTLYRTIDRLIEQRRAGKRAGDDLLGVMLCAADELGTPLLDDRRIRDEVMTLFIAGHETTATALGWACSLLAEHPEVRHALQTELDAVLDGRLPQVADLPRLPFCRAVFDEVLRLYPPAALVLRTSREARLLGGYRIPPGDMLIVSFFNIHRHPDFWTEPDTFAPERWLTQPAIESNHRLAYLPFGAGPRVCVAARFAQTEGVILLAALMSRFIIDNVKTGLPKPEMTLTLRPQAAWPMRCRVRQTGVRVGV